MALALLLSANDDGGPGVSNRCGSRLIRECSPWVRCYACNQRAFVGRIGPRIRSSTRPDPRNGVADLLPRHPVGGSSRDNKLGSCRPPLRCGQRCGAAVLGHLTATRPRWSRAWNTAQGVTSCPRSVRSPATTMAPTPAPSKPSQSTPRRASSPAILPPTATRRPTCGWCLGRRDRCRLAPDLEGEPHLPLGQARRSVVHRPHLRQPLRRRERRICPDLVALISTRGAPPNSRAPRNSPRYYAEQYRRQSPGKPQLSTPDSA